MTRAAFTLCFLFLASASQGQIIQKNAGPSDAGLKFQLPPPEPLTPEQALSRLVVAPGYKVELVASEPVIQAPVAMSFDAKGRLYVVEMRGYCHDMSYQSEKAPSGRITRLQDKDGDGRMESHTVFLDAVVMPRAVLPYGDGAIVSVPPNLIYCHDADDDGVAEKQDIIATDYAKVGGQPEHMANSLTLTMDNWIWSANHNKRYKQTATGWIADSVPQLGQWGLCQDDIGRLYFNYNSSMLHSSLLSPLYLRRNTRYQPESLNAKIARKQDVYPIHPTPGVNRGYQPTTLRKDGSLTSATAACSPWLYRADLMPGLRGKVLVCEPSGNIVSQLSMKEKDGVPEATPLKENLLASTDERFRPVSMATGLEGALYVADMARGVIQHPGFVTHYMLKNIEARNLFPPVNLGRIYRIIPADQPTPAAQPVTAEVENLTHTNGTVRDLAQQLLVQQKTSPEPLLALLQDVSKTTTARLHAFWALEGLGAMKPELLATTLKDSAPELRMAAIRSSGLAQLPQLLSSVADPDARVRLHLVAALSGMPGADSAVTQLAQTLSKHPALADAVASGLMGRELEFLQAIAKSNPPMPDSVLTALSACVMKERRSARITTLLELAAAVDTPERTRLALLEGLAPKKTSKGNQRITYLAAKPALLNDLSTAKGKLRDQLRALNAVVAWPDKPGVPPPPVVPPLTAEQQQLYDHGKLIYTGLCAACHQPHGAGMEGLAPPLVDSEWVLGNPQTLARIVLHGVSGSIKVSGRTWKLEMPPLGTLQDKDIAGVLTYIRREWEHGKSPVSVEDIAKQRSKDAGRTALWTEKELLAKNKAK